MNNERITLKNEHRNGS